MTEKLRKDFLRSFASIPNTSVPIQRRGDILPSFSKVLNGCHKPAGASLYISHQQKKCFNLLKDQVVFSCFKVVRRASDLSQCIPSIHILKKKRYIYIYIYRYQVGDFFRFPLKERRSSIVLLLLLLLLLIMVSLKVLEEQWHPKQPIWLTLPPSWKQNIYGLIRLGTLLCQHVAPGAKIRLEEKKFFCCCYFLYGIHGLLKPPCLGILSARN